MVGYKLVKNNNAEVLYEYYPENKTENKGIVSFNKNNGDFEIMERSSEDEFSSYAWHLRSRLQEFNKTGNFRETGYVAWY